MVSVALPAAGAAGAAHDVVFRKPVYGTDSGMQLHRYSEPDFVSRFLTDLASGAPLASDWQDQDRFGDYTDHTTLRLPVHRMFYQVSIELACDRIGHPALDPRRIEQAGFVVRRIGQGRRDAWMLKDGVATGWEPVPGEKRDPDLNRRICRDGRLQQIAQPSYSGEETYPLTPVIDRATGRARTVLYGYLPLGGSHYRQGPLPPPAADGEAGEALRFKNLPWPFGVRGRPASHSFDPMQVVNGVPTEACAQFISRLVLEEHVTQHDGPLAELCRRTYFYDDPNLPAGGFSDAQRSRYEVFRGTSLYDYLRAWEDAERNALVLWVSAFINDGTRPALPGFPPGSQPLDLDLLLSSADLQEYRSLLEEGALARFDQARLEVPIARFQQRAVDVYQVQAFVRYRDDAGAIRVYWGRPSDHSRPFRVAAPFDPEAARPSLIPVPTLKDLKRGLARGVSFMTPPDTMDLLNSLKTEEGLSPDVLPEEQQQGPGLQWLCSFSIPIVTVAAMILLMIVVNILNFFLQWLPYVRICFPLPSAPKEDS